MVFCFTFKSLRPSVLVVEAFQHFSILSLKTYCKLDYGPPAFVHCIKQDVISDGSVEATLRNFSGLPSQEATRATAQLEKRLN